MITQNRLKEVLSYDKDTGIFIWIKPTSRRVTKNSKAGVIYATKYIAIAIDKKRYAAHRLAWLYVHGKFPDNNIDHIDYLHIDVQGNEHSVIKGLGNYRPYFIFAETCEFDTYESGTSLEKFELDLQDMGYEAIKRFRDDTLYKLKSEFVDFSITSWLPKI
jgi:hypothetical protein